MELSRRREPISGVEDSRQANVQRFDDEAEVSRKCPNRGTNTQLHGWSSAEHGTLFQVILAYTFNVFRSCLRYRVLSLISSILLMPLIQTHFDKIAQLFRSQFITLEIGRKFSVPIDDDCVQRVCQRPLVLPEIQAKHPTHRLYR